MKIVSVFLSLLLSSPPEVTIPKDTLATGDYVVLTPTTTAKTISYVGLSGVDPFPSSMLKDPKSFILPTRGLPNGTYRFVGVASLNDEHTQFSFNVKVGKLDPMPPPVNPNPTDPIPPKPTSGMFFLIVRGDGPASPEFTRTMTLEGWKKLSDSGHRYKDYIASDLPKFNITLPPGTTLPCVITLRPRADGIHSDIVRGPIQLPSSSEGIEKLPEGVTP